MSDTRRIGRFPRKHGDTCPTPEAHTPAPASYTPWHEWAEEMSKTHEQERCAGCGRFAVWVPKAVASTAKDGE